MNAQNGEKILTGFCLLEKPAERKNTGEKEGWLSPEEVKNHFGMKKKIRKAVLNDRMERAGL